MNKIDYDKLMRNETASLTSRPSLLLHACCAPCAGAVIPVLTEHFNVDVIFINPNITDPDEYEHRLSELKRLLDIFNQNRVAPKEIALVPYRYAPSEFYDAAFGFENEPEGGLRCSRCFTLRLEETRRSANEKKYDYFCTTLTVSPHKNAELINNIGEELAQSGGAKFLKSDFKKNDGYKKSIELSKKYGLYRQSFCGCEFSKKDAPSK